MHKETMEKYAEQFNRFSFTKEAVEYIYNELLKTPVGKPTEYLGARFLIYNTDPSQDYICGIENVIPLEKYDWERDNYKKLLREKNKAVESFLVKIRHFDSGQANYSREYKNKLHTYACFDQATLLANKNFYQMAILKHLYASRVKGFQKRVAFDVEDPFFGALMFTLVEAERHESLIKAFKAVWEYEELCKNVQRRIVNETIDTLMSTESMIRYKYSRQTSIKPSEKTNG